MIMVMQPANTGKDRISNKDVKTIDHGNNGNPNDEYSIDKLLAFTTVTIKLMDPINEDNPAKCNENIIKSIHDEFMVDNGT